MSDSDELWQGYNLQGEPTGPVTKAQCRTGVLHGAAHVWVWRRKADTFELLLQERAADNLTWPGYLDVSVAGHIDAGETPLVAALRETREEIGLDLSPAALELLFVRHQSIQVPGTDIIENEFQWVYATQWPAGAKLTFQTSEVDGGLWASLDECKAIIAGQWSQRIVNHGEAYFAELFANLRRVAGL